MKLQAIAPLAAAALAVWACCACGYLLIARLGVKLRRGETFPLTFVTGAACLHLAMFALFALHIANKRALMTLALAPIAAAIFERSRRGNALQDSPRFAWSENIPAFGYAALFALFTMLYFVNAWAPEVSADGPGYHLTLLETYLRAHAFVPVTTSMYAGLSEGAEMIFALAVAFGRFSAAALVHFAFLAALALLILAFGKRIGGWWVGAGAAALVYFSPVVGKDGSSAYVDLAAAAVVFAIFYWLELWEESGNDRILLAIGLLCGYAYAVKYTAVIILIYAIGFIIWKKKRACSKPILQICACAAVMILPWMIKDWIWLGDPIAPLGAGIFRNPNISIHLLQDWSNFLRRYDVPDMRAWPLEVTVRGVSLQGFLGPIFLLAPLALLALRHRVGRKLLLAGLVLLIPYPMNIGARFLIPALAFFALAMTLTLANFPRAIAALALAHAALSWPTVMANYSQGWRIVDTPTRAALRLEKEDDFLRRNLDNDAIMQMIDHAVPAGERVLSLAGLPTAYSHREILIGYESAFGQRLVDDLYSGYNEGLRPVVGLTFKFPEQSITQIRVLQTGRAQYPNQWSVTELRFFDRGTELARASAWRVRAWPNPWAVEFAFDNSPATCWRSGEAPSPGMWMEADFGAPHPLDQIEIQEPIVDMWAVTLQVEKLDAGKWIKLAGNPGMHEIPRPRGLARAATFEIARQGVHYIVVRDGDYGAADYAADPAEWGMKIIARTGDANLYRILP